jgi:hypothetical protein
MTGGLAKNSLEARIRAARRLSLDGKTAIYDLTSGIDFSKPRQAAEAIAQVVWEQDVQSWWSWNASPGPFAPLRGPASPASIGGEPTFAPDRKVEIRLPRDDHRKVAKVEKEFREDLKKGEFAPYIGWYVDRLRDDRPDWFVIFFLGPLIAYLLQHWGNRQRQHEELDRLFAAMADYIVVTPT